MTQGQGNISNLPYLPSAALMAGQFGCQIWPAMLTQSDFLQTEPNSAR